MSAEDGQGLWFRPDGAFITWQTQANPSLSSVFDGANPDQVVVILGGSGEDALGDHPDAWVVARRECSSGCPFRVEQLHHDEGSDQYIVPVIRGSNDEGTAGQDFFVARWKQAVDLEDRTSSHQWSPDGGRLEGFVASAVTGGKLWIVEPSRDAFNEAAGYDILPEGIATTPTVQIAASPAARSSVDEWPRLSESGRFWIRQVGTTIGYLDMTLKAPAWKFVDGLERGRPFGSQGWLSWSDDGMYRIWSSMESPSTWGSTTEYPLEIQALPDDEGYLVVEDQRVLLQLFESGVEGLAISVVGQGLPSVYLPPTWASR